MDEYEFHRKRDDEYDDPDFPREWDDNDGFDIPSVNFELELYVNIQGWIELTVQDGMYNYQLIDAETEEDAINQFKEVLYCIKQRFKKHTQYSSEELFNDMNELTQKKQNNEFQTHIITFYKKCGHFEGTGKKQFAVDDCCEDCKSGKSRPRKRNGFGDFMTDDH